LDFNKIKSALTSAVNLAEQFLPLIPGLGQVGALAATGIKIIGAVSDIVEHTQQAIADGKIVASSQDQAWIKEQAQKLHDINDQLAQQIDDS